MTVPYPREMAICNAESGYVSFNSDARAFTKDEWKALQNMQRVASLEEKIKMKDKDVESIELERSRYKALSSDDETLPLSNVTNQPTGLVALATDVKGQVTIPPSEALIRAREACIAGQYVVGLDAEMQVRAGMHDDWLPLQIAYNALITKDIDVDVLRKYHAPGQLALAKAEQRPVIVRER